MGTTWQASLTGRKIAILAADSDIHPSVTFSVNRVVSDVAPPTMTR
jgi:hypothetical protein